jgi:hypothetical protein
VVRKVTGQRIVLRTGEGLQGNTLIGGKGHETSTSTRASAGPRMLPAQPTRARRLQANPKPTRSQSTNTLMLFSKHSQHNINSYPIFHHSLIQFQIHSSYKFSFRNSIKSTKNCLELATACVLRGSVGRGLLRGKAALDRGFPEVSIIVMIGCRW